MIFNNPFTTGTIAGVAMIGYNLLLYWIDPIYLFNPLLYWLSWLLPLLFLIPAAMRLYKYNEELTLQSATSWFFRIFLMASLLFYLFYFILHALDPSLLEVQRTSIRTYLESHPEWQGKADLDKMTPTVTLGIVFFNWVFSLIPGFFISLVLGAFVRK